MPLTLSITPTNPKRKPIRCPRGQRVTPDGKSCVDRNECLDNPCHNGGTCINRDTQERYTCLCSTGFSGQNCELMQEEQILRLSMGALAVILICLLMILSNCGTSVTKDEHGCRFVPPRFLPIFSSDSFRVLFLDFFSTENSAAALFV